MQSADCAPELHLGIAAEDLLAFLPGAETNEETCFHNFLIFHRLGKMNTSLVQAQLGFMQVLLR
jgi:hypothetical protein